jgi:hypothetical protein
MSQFLKPGKLYFLGEKDLLTGEHSKYIKIGLVYGEKDVSARTKEHQTGNPRAIFDYHTIEMIGVSKIETLMHKLYAKNRLIREWFILDENQLKEATQKAEELKKEMESNEEFLSISESASEAKPEDLTDSRSPSSEDLSLLEKIKNLKLESIRLNFEQSVLETKLKLAMKDHTGIEGILIAEPKKESDSLDTARLKKEHPDLHAKYIEPKEAFKRDFKIEMKSPTTPKLIGERYKQLKEQEEQIPQLYSQLNQTKLKLTDDLKSLHFQYLEVFGKVEAIEYELIMNTMILEGRCGYSKGIEDVCSYDFKEKTTNNFSKDKFKEDYPDLYQKYLKTGETEVKYTVLDHRSYAG